jgi:hypothetical protein
MDDASLRASDADRERALVMPTPPKTKAPARCLEKTAPRTPQTAMTTPPAPVSGAAALLAVSKAASLRIVDGVRTPTAALRDRRPCRNWTANPHDDQAGENLGDHQDEHCGRLHETRV